MLELGFMVIVRAVDDRPLATTSAELRALAEAVLTIGADHGVFTFDASPAKAPKNTFDALSPDL